MLALPAGDRRMANVRKLMRMAREYEAEEGRDLRGFIDFVAERDLIQEREGQAPLEAEELDAVRLMTIHRAKGLEFPVVCVADLGKGGREDDDALRISDDGEVGLRLAAIGGGSVDSEELERIKERRKLEAEEEEKRIFYVAVTRAAGAPGAERRHRPREARRGEAAGGADALGLALVRARAARAGGGRGGRRPVRRARGARACTVLRPADLDAMLPPRTDRQPARAGRRGGRAGRRRSRSWRPSGARRAAGEPPQLLGARGLQALRLPLLPRAGAAESRGERRAAVPAGTGTRSRRCCGARSCTSCSSGSTSPARSSRA